MEKYQEIARILMLLKSYGVEMRLKKDGDKLKAIEFRHVKTKRNIGAFSIERAMRRAKERDVEQG